MDQSTAARVLSLPNIGKITNIYDSHITQLLHKALDSQWKHGLTTTILREGC